MPERARHPSGWLSYDSVAALYERVAVPWFEPLARDLLRSVELSPGARVLDVGAGTGLGAALAAEALGPGAFVVGVDPSIGMLGLARQRHLLVMAGMAPGLAVRSACFDVVVANLVVSHLPDLHAGIADMVRTLRPGGRLGFTAWGPDPEDADDQSATADAIIASVRDDCGLPGTAPAQGAPFEAALRGRAGVIDALAGAGCRAADARLCRYRHCFSADDYASGWGGLGRYLRAEAGERRWQDFTRRAAAALGERLGETITTVKQAWVAVGVAP